MPSLRNEVIQRLESRTRGAVLRPSDSGYEEARKIWNAMIDRRPALIVRCAGAADVMASLAFAHEQKLSVAVRGGGHNIAGNAVAENSRKFPEVSGVNG